MAVGTQVHAAGEAVLGPYGEAACVGFIVEVSILGGIINVYGSVLDICCVAYGWRQLRGWRAWKLSSPWYGLKAIY